jgi:hypothetical protein
MRLICMQNTLHIHANYINRFCRKLGRLIRLSYVSHSSSASEQVMIKFKERHFNRHVIPRTVHWYVACLISYRQLEEIMEAHDVEVDHAMLNR